MPGPSFDISTAPNGATVVVSVVGDIDLVTAPRLREALAAEHDGPAELVVVDLAGVPFLDSSALGALVSAHREFADDGRRLAIVAPQSNVLRVLQITRLTQVIPVHDSVEALIAASS